MLNVNFGMDNVAGSSESQGYRVCPHWTAHAFPALCLGHILGVSVRNCDLHGRFVASYLDSRALLLFFSFHSQERAVKL